MDVEFVRYRFQDGHDGVIVKNKVRPGVRHVQALYVCACAAALGALRAGAAVAARAMSDVTACNHTDTQIYEWSEVERGTVMSSYFLGYAALVVPAELAARRAGGWLTLAAALLTSGALSLAVPAVARTGGVRAVAGALAGLGAAQATLAPAARLLLARWLPPAERRVISRLVYAGIPLGTVLALPAGGALLESRLCWRLAWFAQAMLALSAGAVWTLLAASGPDRLPAVGDAEREFIREALSYYRKKSLSVPWRRVFRSAPVWAATCAHAASAALLVFYLAGVPAWRRAVGASFWESSWQAALPVAAMCLTHACTAPTLRWLGDALRERRLLDITHYRKLVNGFGALCVVCGLCVSASVSGGGTAHALLALAATGAAHGLQLSGFLESYRDMSHNFAGRLLTLSSAAASAAAALVPLLAGCVLDGGGGAANAMHRWRTVFLSLAGVYAASNVVYTAFGSSERQPWDGGEVVRKGKFGYHNGVVDTDQLELEGLSDAERAQHGAPHA